MTAKELFEWCLDNVHTSNWRLPMATKVLLPEKLTEEQRDAILMFGEVICSQKFYQATDPVVRVNDIKEIMKIVKTL